MGDETEQHGITETVDGVSKRADLRVVTTGNDLLSVIIDSVKHSTLCYEDTFGDLKVFTPVTWDSVSNAQYWIRQRDVEYLRGQHPSKNIRFRATQVLHEPKKEFVVVEKLLSEHRDSKNKDKNKNKIFIWLLNHPEGIRVQACHNGTTKNLVTISEKGVRFHKAVIGVGITLDKKDHNKIKLIS